MGLDVVAEDAAARAGAGDVRNVDAQLPRESTDARGGRDERARPRGRSDFRREGGLNGGFYCWGGRGFRRSVRRRG